MTNDKSQPVLVWRWASRPITRDIIGNVEKLWKVIFPVDFVDCAKDNHGGHPNRKCFDFPGHKEAVFNRLLSFTEEDQKTTITRTQEAVKNRMPDGVFPFAEDPFGNLICFDYRLDEHKPKIVFWDHEIANQDRDKTVSEVAETFSALISSLYNPD